jgi:dipeptidyl aminopeptidase/acylaminoacyl peptidase
MVFPAPPRWSPDGKWIAFDHHNETHSQIYLIDSEGRNMHAVTSGNYENMVPGWSRDRAAVYFASNRTGSLQVRRRELATGSSPPSRGSYAGLPAGQTTMSARPAKRLDLMPLGMDPLIGAPA